MNIPKDIHFIRPIMVCDGQDMLYYIQPHTTNCTITTVNPTLGVLQFFRQGAIHWRD